jgi:hypothetical protein
LLLLLLSLLLLLLLLLLRLLCTDADMPQLSERGFSLLSVLASVLLIWLYG